MSQQQQRIDISHLMDQVNVHAPIAWTYAGVRKLTFSLEEVEDYLRIFLESTAYYIYDETKLHNIMSLIKSRFLEKTGTEIQLKLQFHPPTAEVIIQ